MKPCAFSYILKFFHHPASKYDIRLQHSICLCNFRTAKIKLTLFLHWRDKEKLVLYKFRDVDWYVRFTFPHPDMNLKPTYCQETVSLIELNSQILLNQRKFTIQICTGQFLLEKKWEYQRKKMHVFSLQFLINPFICLI